MKKVFLFLLLASAIVVHSQSSDEKKVAAMIEQLNNALVAADSNTLIQLTTDAVSYGHSSGAVEDKQTFVHNATFGPFKYISITTADQTINVVKDAAVVRQHALIKATNNGTPTDLNLSVLQVWQKQKGKWKLLARQAVKL